MILTHRAFKLAIVVLSPLMNPLLRKKGRKRAKKAPRHHEDGKFHGGPGIGILQKASIERRSVGWGYWATRSHLRGKVSRRGPGSLMHERHGTQNVHWHAPATLAREPSFAAQMSNANDPNETVLTLVRLSMSPSLPLLPDATALLGVIAAEPLPLIAPDSSLSNAEPSISRRHRALIGSTYFRSYF